MWIVCAGEVIELEVAIGDLENTIWSRRRLTVPRYLPTTVSARACQAGLARLILPSALNRGI